MFAFNANNFYLRWSIWDTLIIQGADNRPRLALAEKFEMKPDFTGVNVKLRSGLTFHDGRALTAENVRYSIELFRADTTTSQLKNPGKLISDIKIVDPLTLDISFSARRPWMEDYFALLPIVDEKTVAQAAQMKTINGSGPFKFASYTPNQGYELVRNENYWDTGKPYLDKIQGRIYSDTQARILALQTGELMHASQITPEMVKALRSSKDVVVTDGGVGGSWYAGLVVDFPALKDTRVRQALTLAIDRKRIASEWGEGVIQPQVLPWPKESPAYIPEDEALLVYDPEKAKSLLKQAGAEGITIPMDIGQSREALAQFVQDDWKAIGINAQLNVGEYSAYLERFRTRKVNGGMFVSPFGFSDNMHPGTFFDFAQPVRIPNASHYQPDSYKNLLAKIAEIDPNSSEGKAVLREWNKLYLVDDPWMAPLAPNNTFFAMRKQVIARPDGARDAPPLSEVWIDA
ncbi:MAG: ABC transporter substrate-binding protein [Dehalococcoidia bacterium]|nr:ABC transporter substrate-binding protein [Dehalococcoidia bacterium]